MNRLECETIRIDLELAPQGKGKVQIINRERLLVGRSRCCEIVINHADVSAIHAAIEVKGDKVYVYDMNSSNGTFVKNEKIISAELKIGDAVRFGKNEYQLRKFSLNDVPELPLQVLEDSLPPRMSDSERQLPEKGIRKDVVMEDVYYPLAKDPKADYSEYIFEDVDQLFPIFKYEIAKKSIEVIILFRDEIFSVDYLPLKDHVYSLRGRRSGKGEVELLTLQEDDVHEFISVKNGDVFVEKPEGFSSLSIKNKENIDTLGAIVLDDDDIICFRSGSLQIFVRGAEAPPVVKNPPVMRMDHDFKKYLLLMLFLVISFLFAMTMFEVNKEIEKEKIPERIATILYKKKLIVKKRVPKIEPKKISQKKILKPAVPKTVRKTEKKKDAKKVVKKEVPRKKVQVTGEKHKKKSAPIKKAATKVKKESKKVIVKKIVKPKKSSGKQRSVRKVKSPLKRKGVVDTYVSTDFTNTLSSFLSKGAKVKNAKFANQLKSDDGKLRLDSSVASSSLKQAIVKHDVGSLTGAATGKRDSAKGMEGIESKKKAIFMDVPIATVTLSSMDPEVVRSILMDYLPQFKFCYQKVLERSSKSFDGTITLEFVIGASGHVADAGLSSEGSRMPAKVKGCVIDVLRGIKFPEPLGGGKVGVKQPMNFRINN